MGKSVAIQLTLYRDEGTPTSLEKRYSICKNIFSFMALGKSFRQACKQFDVVHRTVIGWILKPVKDLSLEEREFVEWAVQHYAMARRDMFDAIAQEALDIADDTSGDYVVIKNDNGQIVEVKLNKDNVNRARLRVDTRKWLLSKLDPGRYGDRVTVAGDPDNPVRTVKKIERVIVKVGQKEAQEAQDKIVDAEWRDEDDSSRSADPQGVTPKDDPAASQ